MPSVVLEGGAAELIKAVEKGDIPVSTAAGLARAPHEEQSKAIESLPRDAKGKVTSAGKKTLSAAAKAVPKKARSPGRAAKPVPKVKDAKTEKAAPTAKAFKIAINSFASASEYLFNPMALIVLEHAGMPDEQRRMLTGYLFTLIQRAEALRAKLDTTRAGPVERAVRTSREREKAAAMAGQREAGA